MSALSRISLTLSVANDILLTQEIYLNDGPFKNQDLDRRSRAFLRAITNAASDREANCAHAMHAVVGGLINEAGSLIKGLTNLRSGSKLDLDPVGEITRVFDCQPASQAGDSLKRHLLGFIHDGRPIVAAIDGSLEAAIDDRLRQFRTRMVVACTEAFNNDLMDEMELATARQTIDQAIALASRERLCAAWARLDKQEFSKDVQKRKGIDEGPNR